MLISLSNIWYFFSGNKHIYQYINGAKYWSGYCSNSFEAAHVSFQDEIIKAAYCQTDLCNSVENMRNLENMTLCEDGFYE